MYRLLVIAKNNMKKQKGDMITFFILTLIAVFLIFDCVSAITGLGKVLDNKFEEVNGAHVVLVNKDAEVENEAAKRAFEDNKHLIEYEKTPLVGFTTGYKKEGEKEFIDYSFYVESFEEDMSIMNVERPDVELNEDDILLPLNLKSKFAVGDTIIIKLEDEEYKLNVKGYLEDPYFCSTINITVYSCNMAKSMLDKMVKDHPDDAVRFNAYKGIVDEKILDDDYGTDDLEKEINDAYKENIAELSVNEPPADYTGYMMINWQGMRGGSQFLPLVVIAILLFFAMLILIITIVIMAFGINNFIQKNMKNTGILEASGYTVSELRLALISQILIVTGSGSLVGLALAILTFDKFGDIVSSVLGLTWNQPVNVSIAIASVLGTLVFVELVAAFISRAYKKISVLDALRGGINAHNFKRNFFPFEKTRLPLPIVLSLKDTFGGLSRNIVMIIIAIILSVSTVGGFGMLENFGIDPEGLMDIMGFEMSTAMVNDDSDAKDYDKIADEIRDLENVDKVLMVTRFEPVVKFNGKEETVFTYAYDDVDNASKLNITEGRAEKKDNEIIITEGVSEDLGVKVGDVVKIGYAGSEAEYIVVGINQRVERMGRTVCMTIDGAKRIVNTELTPSYYVNAKDGVDYKTLENDLKKLSNDKGYRFACTDMDKMMGGTIDTLGFAMKMLCFIIVIITTLIVIFVESLVIRAKISREWRGMGVSKALGQTTGSLVSQIMLSNIPAVVIGSIIGALIAPFVCGKGCELAFSLFVIKNIEFNVSPIWMIVAVVGIAVVAVLSSAVAGLKVRKLNPVEMISEE